MAHLIVITISVDIYSTNYESNTLIFYIDWLV